MASIFTVGKTFSDYQTLEREVEKFEKENFVKLCKNDSRKIKAAAVRYPGREFTEELVYAELKYCCHHGGKSFTSRSKGDRPNQTTGKIGCPFTIRSKATKDGQFLEVVSAVTEHNHQVSEIEYKFHPRVRKVDRETEEEIAQHLKFNANRKLVQQSYKEKTGKKIILKDIHNIATSFKATEEPLSQSSEVQSLFTWIQTQFPGIDCKFVVNDSELTGIYIQDPEMKSTFQRFPEVLLSDSTYKTNNVNMALYVLMAVDGNSESHIVAAFLLSKEDKISLTDMMQRFKTRNPQWQNTQCIITDKDMTERSVFKSELPQVQPQICLYHTLRTFSREVTLDKMQISSQQRADSLKHLEKLAYSFDEDAYCTNYEDFLSVVPERVASYYNANWHEIRNEWVKGLKSYHLQNDTTNRVESFFSTLKKYFHPRSSLKEMLSGLMGCIEAQRSERHYRQVRLLNRVKLTTSRPTSYEKEYKQLLIPFASDCVANEIKHMNRTIGDHMSSIDSCDCIFFRCMSLPCRHIFRERAEAGMYLLCADLVAERWTSSYNNPINFRPAQEAVMSASKATPSRRKKILTGNEKFKLASKKLQKFATLLAETGMDEFDRKMKFLDGVLMNWEEDKECQLVNNEPATVGDDTTIQDDLGCEPLNQDEEVAEIHDDDQTESHQILDPPQETSINLEQVVLPTKMRKRGRPKGSNKTAIGLPKKRKCAGPLSTLTLKRVENGDWSC